MRLFSSCVCVGLVASVAITIQKKDVASFWLSFALLVGNLYFLTARNHGAPDGR